MTERAILVNSIAREEILKRFRAQIEQGIPIIGSGAGVGLSAQSAARGGADLIIIYNSGRFRMAGRGSSCGRFAFSDGNGIVMKMAEEILPVAQGVPVIAGVFSSDPYRDIDKFLVQVKERGFAGIQNFPTIGGTGPDMLKRLEVSGYGYSREVELVRKARSLDLLTTPYCFTVEQTEAMAKAGADIIVAHMGLTTKGLIGAAVANDLDQCVREITDIVNTAKSINPDVMVICHGGPIAEPEDAQYIFDNVEGIVGFYGASSSERIPTEKEILSAVEAYKQLKINI